MITDKYQIVEVIKENGKDPKIYDWDMEQYPLGENSWLLVYEKEAGNKEKTPISFLGTRYMATTDNCIRVIHATQTVIINHTCKVFFFDYGNEDEQENMQKGFMFRLSGWLIPKDAIY